MNYQQTEARFLSAVLRDPTALDNLEIEPADFSDKEHKAILRAIFALRADNIPTSIHSIGRRLCDSIRDKTPQHEEAVQQMLMELATLSGVGTAEAELNLIRADANKNRLMDIGLAFQSLAQAEHITSDEAIARAEEMMLALSSKSRRFKKKSEKLGTIVRGIVEQMRKTFENPTQLLGCETGIAELDNMIGGFVAGELTVIAGRPAMGKTGLLTWVMRAFSKTQNKPVLIFSMEMTNEGLGRRQVAGATGIPVHAQRRGHFLARELEEAERFANECQDMGMFFCDESGLTIQRMRAEIARMIREEGIAAIGVDYLQLMRGPEKFREQEVAEVSRGLKAIAKDFNLPVISLAQLNRGLESRIGDKRPQTADLRESGSIEQEANNIVMIHREFVYDPNFAFPDLCELIVRKARDGQLGTILLRFDGPRVEFYPWDGPDPFGPQSPKPGKAGGLMSELAELFQK